MTVRDALNLAAKRIPREDARVLLMHALEVDAAKLISIYSDELEESVSNVFFDYVSRREKGEPAAYITGKRGFYGLDFIVTPDVLIPRAETEILVERALSAIPEDAPSRVLDLCTGSGCIGLSIARTRKNAAVTLCDISEAAIRVAKRNADALGICANLICKDVNKLSLDEGVFDVIVSNPPYIKTEQIPKLDVQVKEHEPYIALCGGEDGLVFYRTIARRFFCALTPGGMLAFESGDEADGKEICEKIARILEEYGYTNIEILPDLSGHMRVVAAFTPDKADTLK